jgi:hypothetical protein
MADRVTPPISNPELASWYDGLYPDGYRHAAENTIRQQTMMFSSNCWLKLIPKHITLQYYTTQFFPVFL